MKIHWSILIFLNKNSNTIHEVLLLPPRHSHCHGKRVLKLHFQKLVLVKDSFECLLFLFPAVPSIDQVRLCPCQDLPVFQGLVVGPAFMFEGHVLPTVFLPDVGITASEAGEGLDGDFEMGAEDMSPKALTLWKPLVALGARKVSVKPVGSLHVVLQVVLDGERFAALLAGVCSWVVAVMLAHDVVLQTGFVLQLCPANVANNLCGVVRRVEVLHMHRQSE